MNNTTIDSLNFLQFNCLETFYDTLSFVAFYRYLPAPHSVPFALFLYVFYLVQTHTHTHIQMHMV